ncbi:MAG: plastocyanin/azurin family copper-binding protein [Halobacteriota archaeon]
MRSTRTTAAVVFVTVFVAVLTVGGLFGVVLDDGPDANSVSDHVELENPQYDADRVVSDEAPGTATVEMDSAESGTTVVIDVGGTVTERDVSPLVNTLVDAGHDVEVLTGPGGQLPVGLIGAPVQEVESTPAGDQQPRLGEALGEAHGFISVGVSGYADADLDAIDEFLENGGRAVVATNPGQEFASAEGVAGLYSELDVYTEPGYVYNLEENDLNYQRIFAEPTGTSELTEDVDRAVFDSATPVAASTTEEAMEPIAGSELSVTREATDAPVLVRNGSVAMIGDTRFMTPENTQRADNDVLVGNIADFLVEADRAFENETASNGTEGTGTEQVTVEVAPGGEPVFEPQVTEIEPGTTVRFEWKSGGYNVVPVNQQPADLGWEGVEEPREEGYVHEYTFEEEGVHEFVSEPHQDQGMIGAIIVGDPGI